MLDTLVPGPGQKTADANLDCVIAENTFFFKLSLDCSKVVE